MGTLRTGSGDIYRYLRRSVVEFDGVTTFYERMSRAGFEDIRVQTMDGWQTHVVHTFLGRRPGLAADDPLLDPEVAEVETPPEGVPAL